MSFLTEVAVRRLATVSRTSIVRTAPRAAFSSSIILQKTATETAKDALKTVDRAVSDKIVDGIDATCKPLLLLIPPTIPPSPSQSQY